MRTLIVFYSRMGTTKKVGEKLAELISAETEEIIDAKDRTGAWGFIMSGRDAMKKRPAGIKPSDKNLSEYDLVIAGTPVWAGTVSAPMRTFLKNNKENFKQVAFFCTMGGRGSEKTLAEMENISGKKPLATLALTTKEVMSGNFEEKLKEFSEKLNV